MFNLISFIINNIAYIIVFIILSIPFYMWFYKYFMPDIDYEKRNKVSEKNLYLDRIDIIENKVYILIILFFAVLFVLYDKVL